MLEIRKCRVCGKEFEAHKHNHNCCTPECAYEWTKKRAREKDRERRAKKTKPKTLRELSVEATAHGMTYGKYVAQLELKK